MLLPAKEASGALTPPTSRPVANVPWGLLGASDDVAERRSRFGAAIGPLPTERLTIADNGADLREQSPHRCSIYFSRGQTRQLRTGDYADFGRRMQLFRQEAAHRGRVEIWARDNCDAELGR